MATHGTWRQVIEYMLCGRWLKILMKSACPKWLSLDLPNPHLRTLSLSDTTISVMSSPRTNLTPYPLARLGTMLLNWSRALISWEPICNCCHQQNKRNWMDSSKRTLLMVESVCPNPPLAPQCFLWKRKMVVCASSRTIGNSMTSPLKIPILSPSYQTCWIAFRGWNGSPF